MELKESKTIKNLYTAFTGEVTAHAKYLLFEEKAQEEGFEQIAEIFKYSAENELEHAKLWFKALGFLKETKNNLEDAKSAEHFEASEMYLEFAQTAEEEGFIQLARLFRGVAKIEANHEKRFEKLLENIENNEVFEKDNEVMWECRECGHIHVGKEAPKMCPICNSEQAFFQIFAENY